MTNRIYPEGSMLQALAVRENFRCSAGLRFVVEDYVNAEDAEDGVAFYWGSANGGGNNVTCPADNVELVKSAREMAMRKPPTAAEIADDVAGELMMTSDLAGIDVDESETHGDAVRFYGETEDGLRVAFTVRVIAVERVDF